MKRMEHNEGLAVRRTVACGRKGAEWTMTPKAGEARTIRKRQATFNVEFLHDTVWEGY